MKLSQTHWDDVGSAMSSVQPTGHARPVKASGVDGVPSASSKMSALPGCEVRSGSVVAGRVLLAGKRCSL